jgi:hypothetical protein
MTIKQFMIMSADWIDVMGDKFLNLRITEFLWWGFVSVAVIALVGALISNIIDASRGE